MRYLRHLAGACFFCGALGLLATVFGGVQGLIHDPQHRPMAGAIIWLQAAHSDWAKSVTSDDAGEFQFTAVPTGEYIVAVNIPGFASLQQQVLVTSDQLVRIHLQLELPQVRQSVEVSATAEQVTTEAAP